jgi:hypothetical protein
MASRVVWLTVALTGASVLTVLSAVSSLRLQTDGRQGQESRSATAGPVSPSVIGSLQAHGANDSVIDNAAPAALPPPPIGQDWVLDLLVLWRWPGQAPELSQSAVGGEVSGADNVHRIVVADRDLHVRFDPHAGTARVGNGPVVRLNGANVLMLEVGKADVTVAGTAMVDPRYSSDPGNDPMATLIARSPEVAAFTNRTR